LTKLLRKTEMGCFLRHSIYTTYSGGPPGPAGGRAGG